MVPGEIVHHEGQLRGHRDVGGVGKEICEGALEMDWKRASNSIRAHCMHTKQKVKSGITCNTLKFTARLGRLERSAYGPVVINPELHQLLIGKISC
ncbi:MAG: hypothetical protein ABSH41_18535 [Syntrophobacteraceae bacterium]|jgi:hypothetical protein